MARLPRSDGALECQFKGKGKFEHVEISLTNGDLVFKQKGQKQHRTASAVGSSLSFPKKAAKGRAHTFHIDLAAKDSNKCKKYVFSLASEAELAKWVECFRAYSAMSHDDVAQALDAAAAAEQAASAAEAQMAAEAQVAAEANAAAEAKANAEVKKLAEAGVVPGSSSVDVTGDEDVDTVGTKAGEEESDDRVLSPVDSQKFGLDSGAYHHGVKPGDDSGDAAFLDDDGQDGRAEARMTPPELREQRETMSVVVHADADATGALTPTVGLAPLETEAVDTLWTAAEEQETVAQTDAAAVVSEAEASAWAVSEWCRASIHAAYVSECVTAMQRSMVETLGDLLFLVPSSTALYHLDLSAVAAGALWNALAPYSEEQARQQLELESGIQTTKPVIRDNATGKASAKLHQERQKHARTKPAARGKARRKKAVEPVVGETEKRNTTHESGTQPKKKQECKQENAAVEESKAIAHADPRSNVRLPRTLFAKKRLELKHKRDQLPEEPKPMSSAASDPQDESSLNVSEQPRKQLQVEVAARSTRQLSGTLSREEREMAKQRLVSATSTSMRKRQGALTPPPMPPMTPIRPAASISRLQHLSSPSPIRMAAKLESSPELHPRTTLSRIERLKAQERLTSPVVPRKSESPDRSALNVRTLPNDATYRLKSQSGALFSMHYLELRGLTSGEQPGCCRISLSAQGAGRSRTPKFASNPK